MNILLLAAESVCKNITEETKKNSSAGTSTNPTNVIKALSTSLGLVKDCGLV